MKFYCEKGEIRIICSISDHRGIDSDYLEKFIKGNIYELKDDEKNLIGLVIKPMGV